jgi:hypothetical protein
MFCSRLPMGSAITMTLFLVIVIIALLIGLSVSVRKRRFFNRGRGTFTGRWNRRL